LFSITSTFLYFQQVRVVSHVFADRAAQTAFFATLDLVVNCLTLALQLFFTGRIVVLLGVALALALLPALTIVGFGSLAAMPSLATIAVFQVLRRAGDYAIARPTREVLYTVLPREDRYKTKSFIDTFVYRLGDQVGAWASAALRALGDNVAAAAMVAMAVAGLWLVNVLWLGRREAVLAQTVAVPADGE
jgi:AAA family ATP:ADP antiporter